VNHLEKGQEAMKDSLNPDGVLAGIRATNTPIPIGPDGLIELALIEAGHAINVGGAE